MFNKKLILFVFLLFSVSMSAQDNTAEQVKAYPYKIGSIGFAVDSIDIVIGNVTNWDV
jgi:hypothetical protein